MLSPTLIQKQEALDNRLASCGQIVIAYSGGVDSAFLAYAAMQTWQHERLPSPPRAVMAVSPSLATGELQAAKSLAQHIGIELVIISTNEIDSAGYRENSPRRCYYCKSTLYKTIQKYDSLGPYDSLLNGTNADDLGDFRPGLQAASEFNVKSPLAECGLTKHDIRSLAKAANLTVWDKPATPCLASRILYGLEVIPTRLKRIDDAEAAIRNKTGIRNLRVRMLADDKASLEVPLEDLPRCQNAPLTDWIKHQLLDLGFRHFEIDPRGFRSGSLNEHLSLKTLKSDSAT